MAASADDGPIDDPRLEQAFRIDPVLARRLVGVALLVVVVAGVFLAADLSRLDTMREDVAGGTSPVAVGETENCFQGFCFEESAGLFETWWDFTAEYLRLVWPALLLAFVVGGLVDGFLLPTRAGPAYGTWQTSGVAARVEVAETSLAPARGRPDVPTALMVGALGGPALAMTIVLLTPAGWLTRFGLALVASAPLLVTVRRPASGTRLVPSGSAGDEIRSALRWAGTSAWRFGLRLAPFFVIAGAAGALATRYLTVEGVEAVAGRHPLGVVAAAVFGLLLTLPLTFGLPIAALGLLIGADPVVAGVFLVTAGLGGVTTLLRVPRLPRRERLAVVAAVVLALAGSTGVLGVVAAARAVAGGPAVVWDGERCEYAGPPRLDTGVNGITVRNDADEAGGRTLAVILGRLPSNVSLDHFAATVGAVPDGSLPVWFEVAGTAEFVSAGTEHQAAVRFDEPGRYTAVCVESDVQPPEDRFAEAEVQSEAHPADRVFEVG